MSSTKEQILAGSTTAFWDASCNSNLAYRPQFISNNHTAGQKVLATIENKIDEKVGICLKSGFPLFVVAKFFHSI